MEKIPVISAILKLVELFTPAQRRTAIVLVFLMMGGMILETLGIGLVVPAIMLLTRGDLAAEFPQITEFIDRAGLRTPDELIVAGMLALATVYAIKCFYVAWLTGLQMRFVYGMQADISRRLFVGYLHKPYTFHLQRNSSELVRNVVTATNELTLTGLVSLLILLTEVLVLAGISILLVWYEPVATIVAGAFLISLGLALNFLTRRGIRRAGEARQVQEELRIRYLQQAMGGAKELKLLGRERGAVLQYSPPNTESARIGQYQATLQALPKLWLELLAVLGLVALVLTLVWQNKPVGALIPTIGMFAAAAFRLIPSMNRILGSLQFIRYSIPTINMLHSELKQPEDIETGPHRTKPQLSGPILIDHIAVSYPGAGEFVINDTSFTIEPGTTVGLIGESGAGKSTLVDAILGLLPLDAGTISVGGEDIQLNLRGWQDQIGYVPQSIYLTDDTIRRNIAFGLPDDEVDQGAVGRAVSAAQLDTFIMGLPAGLDTIAGEHGVRLSGGQRQRIGIARALYHNPSVLVLDEATSALDIETENGVMQSISALHGSKTILIVTHRTNSLSYCDRVFRVSASRVHETRC